MTDGFPLTSLEDKDVIWSKYQLSPKSIKVIEFLIMNPISNIAEISRNTGLSKYQVKNIYDELKSKGFFRSDSQVQDQVLGTRQQTELEIVIDREKLGLQKHVFLLNSITSRETLQNLEMICEIFPYIEAKSLAFSDGIHLILEFSCPPDTHSFINNILQFLQKRGQFGKYSHYFSTFCVENQLNMFRWDVTNNKWNLQLEDTSTKNKLFSPTSRLELLWRYFRKDYDPTSIPSTSTFAEFDQFDLLLLRELEVNANLKVGRLAEFYDKHYTTISKRLKDLHQHVIRKNKLYFDNSIFGLNTNIIIFGQFRENEVFNAKTLYDFINSNQIPFSTKAIINKYDFTWQIKCPSNYISDFSRFVWSKTKSFQILNLDIDNSKSYKIDPTLYSEGWEDNNDLLFEKTIEKIQYLMN